MKKKIENSFWEEKMLNVKNNVFHQKRPSNTLAIIPQWLSDDHLLPRYGQKRVVYDKCPNIFITEPPRPHPPNYEKKKNKLFRRQCLTNRLPTSSQPLSHDNFSPRYGPKRVFFVKWPNMVFTQPPPQKWKKWKHCIFIKSALPMRIQQALKHYHMTIFRGYMADYVFSPGTLTPKLEPRSRKMKKFKVMFFLFTYFLLFIFSKKKIKKSFFFSFFHFFGHILTTFWPENVFFPENEQICLLGLTPLIL